MKTLVVLLALYSSFAWSESVQVEVSNFNFEYKNPKGEGKADSFYYSQLNNLNEVHVAVDKIDDDFKFTVTGAEVQEYELQNAPSFISDAETMSVKGLNLSVADSLNLSMSSGKFQSQKDSLRLDGFSLSCNRGQGSDDQLEEFIQGCTGKMNLKLNKFSNASMVASLNNVFENSIDKGSVGVQSLDMKVTNTKYELAVDVKADISGTVKSKGQISYNSSEHQVVIKISEVKFGILNITSKVFAELKKQQSDTLKVKEPYVYYSLK